MTLSKKILLPALILLSSRAAFARLYNYEDLPLGSRGFGMGNTAMGVTDDVGSIYYNPAVLAWAQGDQVSAGVTAYSRIDTRTGEYVSLFKSAADNVKRGGFLSVPTTVGGFFKKNRYTWGGVVLVPNSFVNAGTLDLGVDSRVSYSSVFSDIWVSAFGTYDIDDRTAVSLGLHYVSRASSEKFSYLQKISNVVQTEFVEKTWDVNGFTAILGISRKQTERFIWGASVRMPVLKFGGTGTLSDVKSGSSDFDAQNFNPAAYPLPMRVSGGFTYTWAEGRTLAADLHLYAPLTQSLHVTGRADLRVSLRAIPNFHVGYEHFFKKSLGARIGFFTNLSAAKTVPVGLSAIHDKVNMYGATAALVFVKENGEISLGGWVQGGQGRSYSMDPAVSTDLPRSNYFYGGVVASSYHF